MSRVRNAIHAVYRQVFGARYRAGRGLAMLGDLDARLFAKLGETGDMLSHAEGRLAEMHKRLQTLESRLTKIDEIQIERGDFLFAQIRTVQAQQSTSAEKRFDELAQAIGDTGPEKLSLADRLSTVSHGQSSAAERFGSVEQQLASIARSIGENRPGGASLADQFKVLFGKVEAANKEILRLLTRKDVLHQFAVKMREKEFKIPRIPPLRDVMDDYRTFIAEGDPLNLWGFELEYLDRKSLWIQINELIFREEYYFSDDLEAPHRIIDGGANVGLSIAFFKALYPNSEIVAFEPNDECYRVAEANIKRNGLSNVTLIKAAIGARKGKQKLYIDPSDNMAARLGASTVAKEDRTISQTVQVEALGDYLDDPVDFLKLDIEGAEAAVLNATKDKLANVDALFCEYHFNRKSKGNNLRDIVDILDDSGFDYQIAKSIWYDDHTEYRPIMHVGNRYSGTIYARKRN